MYIKQKRMKKFENLYEFGKRYLLKKPGIDDSVLEHYLTLYNQIEVKSLNHVCKRMIIHAQNRGGMPNSIGDIDKLSAFLHNFNPKKILVNYSDWQELFINIRENYSPPGRMVIDTPNSHWVKFCKSIISICEYLERFESFEEYESYTNSFISENPDVRLGLPLILKEEIFGYQFALACDFVKETISPQFIKPDVHIKDIFVGVGVCESSDSDFSVFRKVISYCQSIEETPYSVDKVFWLIGSGKLHKTQKMQEKTFKTSKKDFIYQYKKTFMGN